MNQYHVICRGEILPGHDPETAKKTLANRFKVPPRAVERLVSGNVVTVKKNADRKTAEKYRQTAEKCGIRFDILPCKKNASLPEKHLLSGNHGPAGVQRSMTCPHCGYDQSLSSTCIQCGKFTVDTKKREDRQPPKPSAEILPGSEQPRPKPVKGTFKKIRIAVLLTILIAAGLSTWKMHLKVVSWNIPLTVAVYPISADNSPKVSEYIEMLYQEDFHPIQVYLAQEGKKYGLKLDEPFRFVLADEIDALPPTPPEEKKLLPVVWWSLKLRFWAYSTASQQGISPDIKLFVLYYDPTGKTLLDHSMGLKKGMIGIVHAYADARSLERNHVIMAHEILHTVGATDKYDPVSHQPIFPDGYAEPDLAHRYPQRLAEIMGTRIPTTPTTSTMPPDLSHTRIGPLTAREICWTD